MLFKLLCFVTLFFLVTPASEIKDILRIKINGVQIEGNLTAQKPIYLKKASYSVFEHETLKVTCESTNIPGNFVNLSVGSSSPEGERNLDEVPCYQNMSNTACSLSMDITPRTNDTFTCVVTPQAKDVQNNKKTTEAVTKQENGQSIEKYVYSVIFVTQKMFRIEGLNVSKIINETDDTINYEYDEGELIEWHCIFNYNDPKKPKFNTYWEIEKDAVYNKTTNDLKQSGEIAMVLDSQSHIKALVCHCVEDTKQKIKWKGNKTVILSVKVKSEATFDSECRFCREEIARDSADKTDQKAEAEKLDQKSNTMYIVIAIVAVIFLITFLILTAITCRRNKVVNQHPQQNTIVDCNTSIKNSDVITTNEAYLNPVDVYYTDTTPVSSNYSDPYVALYTAPIPKKNRKILTKNEYCNTVKRDEYENVTERKRTNKKESIPYQNLKEEFNSKYANLKDKSDKTYDGVNDTGSDLYYAVVDK